MLEYEFRGPSPSVGLRLIDKGVAVPFFAMSYIKIEFVPLALISYCGWMRLAFVLTGVERSPFY